MQSSSRGAKVRLLAVHTTEGMKRVSDLLAFFNRADAAGSSHASADSTGAVWGPERGFVPYDRAAWTLRNGNPVSDNIEYCGFAKYTREQWLTTEAKGLDAIAMWLAERSIARGIPLVKLSPADVKAGKSGVIGHVDWTTGMNDGTHWDPGPGFPWDVVIAKARFYATPPKQEDGLDMATPYSQWPRSESDKLVNDVAYALLHFPIEDQDKTAAARAKDPNAKAVTITVGDALANVLRLSNQAATRPLDDGSA